MPIVVPDEQMAHFMAVCNGQSENLRYMLPSEVNLTQGTRVRVIGGAFDGIEGHFVKVKGIRSKRVVVSLDGLASVVIAEIADGLIEAIKE